MDQNTYTYLSGDRPIGIYTLSLEVSDGQDSVENEWDLSIFDCHLFADMNLDTIDGGIEYSDMVTVDDTLFFVAENDEFGKELWISNGTAESTYVIDIYPGSWGSQPDYLTEMEGIVYFRALDPDLGIELFRSDGSEAGTYIVCDINARIWALIPIVPDRCRF